MLPVSSGSESIPKTQVETNLVRDNYIRAVIGEITVSLYGELLTNHLIGVMVQYCLNRGLKPIHGNKKIITSKDYGNTKFNLLLKFEDSELVLVSCSNGVCFAYASMFDSL